MALKPTIYKFRINLTDMNRDHYDTLSLTVAQHPSENSERMMARVLALCLNANQQLQLTKGISSTDEPDIWSKSLDGQIVAWIEVGEPDVERVKKATRLAQQVSVYSFNTKADVWWQQNQTKLAQLAVEVVQFDYAGIQAFAQLLQRTLDMSIMLSGDNAYISTEQAQCEVPWQTLQTQN